VADVAPDGDLSLRTIERHHIARVLGVTRWNRREAAQKLGIDPRTLYRKIREYGIEEPAE
jgi:two-component system NtrC family response regulator